mgnify:CR=1 FL=1
MTTDEPLPDRCGAECRDGGYCENYPVQGAERCRMHGGTQPTGADSPNFEHGAYSDHMQSDLTESEREAYEELVDALEDPDQALDAIRELAAEALLKYKRSADQRFLREFRQLADTFNLAPNEDVHELTGDGGGALDVSISREVVDSGSD